MAVDGIRVLLAEPRSLWATLNDVLDKLIAAAE
jgi:hypothetical protein